VIEVAVGQIYNREFCPVNTAILKAFSARAPMHRQFHFDDLVTYFAVAASLCSSQFLPY
jgi:hypothetical protein